MVANKFPEHSALSITLKTRTFDKSYHIANTVSISYSTAHGVDTRFVGHSLSTTGSYSVGCIAHTHQLKQIPWYIMLMMPIYS